MYFRNYGLRKKWLNKSLKNPVSEDTSGSGMVNGNKHCWNLNDTSFSIVIDHCEGKWIGKNLSYWYAESEKCLLTHWLPMASTPFVLKQFSAAN